VLKKQQKGFIARKGKAEHFTEWLLATEIKEEM
jgi:hypothetical protein